MRRICAPIYREQWPLAGILDTSRLMLFVFGVPLALVQQMKGGLAKLVINQ